MPREKPWSGEPFDAIVIGAGPAGSAVGRLLATWGHRVCLINRTCDRSRGLGESLPPSTRKLLETIALLDAVEGAGFYRTTGNTTWWASPDPRVEKFDPSGRLQGYQVFRPDFDRVLLDAAFASGAEVRHGIVRRMDFDRDGDVPLVDVDHDDRREPLSGRFVIDCSGRAGVIARAWRRFERHHRMYAIVGVWCGLAEGGPRRRTSGGDDEFLPDPTHTLVETYDDGWAWSVPISDSVRHVGTMVNGSSPRVTIGRGLGDAYRAEIRKATRVAGRLDGATLRHVFACDASLYSSEIFAGPRFLLAGDAGSFIDPLSSYGVKKALASAWMGAVVVHTCLTHPDRAEIALDFFSRRERDVYLTHLARSREFARTALARHPHAFWAERASIEVADPELGDDVLVRGADVQSAFATIREAASVELAPSEHAHFVTLPVIRGREIALEPAIPLPGTSAGGIRFLDNVDLVALADLSREHPRVPDLFEAYRRSHAPAPLPSVLAAVSFLVAKGILTRLD